MTCWTGTIREPEIYRTLRAALCYNARQKREGTPVKKWIWFACGALSLAALAFAPCIGWYTVGQLAVEAGFIYCWNLSCRRFKTVHENRQVLRKMTRKQKEQFWQNDAKECRLIYTMAFRLFQFLFLSVSAFNIYCCFYAFRIHPVPGLTQADWIQSWICLVLAAVFLAGFDWLGLQQIRANLLAQD